MKAKKVRLYILSIINRFINNYPQNIILLLLYINSLLHITFNNYQYL